MRKKVVKDVQKENQNPPPLRGCSLKSFKEECKDDFIAEIKIIKRELLEMSVDYDPDFFGYADCIKKMSIIVQAIKILDRCKKMVEQKKSL